MMNFQFVFLSSFVVVVISMSEINQIGFFESKGGLKISYTFNFLFCEG